MPSDVNRKLIFDADKVLGAKFLNAQDVAVMDRAIDEAILPLTPPPPAGKFVLGDFSRNQLVPVLPKLRQCVELAISVSPVDFRVNQGERTLAEQKAAVAAGNSRTMHSKHLRQSDGFVWAVDLVCWVNGTISWEFNRYAGVAYAMDRAATQLGIADHVRWGCAWDRVLSDFGGDVKAYLAEAKAYAARHAGSDLLDAPHFEWVV
jgi:peptidoglycan L-alanyl-D-glutamate endopeptidase CwlK